MSVLDGGRARWLLVAALAGGLATGAPAQDTEQPPPDELPTPQEEAFPDPIEDPLDEADEGEEPRAFFEEGVPPEDLDRIDELLEEDAVLLETGFIYDARGRRDPFRSLVRVAEVPSPEGPRPPGIPGLDIDELTVTGLMVTAEGPVAQVRSTGSPISYLIRPGDQLWDGDVIRIDYIRGGAGEVVFRQREDDPTAPKPFREVVKRLQP
ncbi:MAG TPA: hypothetical protein VMT85_17925 [Thermoanaerobaculia bacterium]|nr:hypothetical protein [Thermoanaerobaculia bacterium]